MNIENHLKEIGIYFKNKVLQGDFKFIKSSYHTAKIMIDDKYTFELWIANEPKYSFKFYDHASEKCGVFDYMNFTSQKERLKAYSKVRKHIKEYEDKVVKKEKIKQFNALKKELQLE